jgi:hypothetical protein
MPLLAPPFLADPAVAQKSRIRLCVNFAFRILTNNMAANASQGS